MICGAYPRERGGTPSALKTFGELEGLSPRARGNPHKANQSLYYRGPIPASAGEPLESNLRKMRKKTHY